MVECGDKEHRMTVQIHFKMNGTLGEHRHGSRGNVVEHEAGSVFGQHARSEGAVDGDIDFCGTWMGVWNVHATGLEVSIG